jgi:hypothetical protein
MEKTRQMHKRRKQRRCRSAIEEVEAGEKMQGSTILKRRGARYVVSKDGYP